MPTAHNSKCKCPPVLIVDDNPMNILVIQSYLKSINLQGDQALNGKEAVDKVKERASNRDCCTTYKLVFMDINMPIMDGIEASRIISSMSKSGEISFTPIVAVTAAEETESFHNTFLHSGIDSMVQKPMNKDKFIQVIQRYRVQE